MHQLWGRSVHVETVINDKAVTFTYDGNKVHRKYL
ncbi:BH1113 [Halalkalibacterium halodurans C-125]|uniref:BH1113 protein n=1 Tax=Halalkalibacterium halodurans (strain ATCC BAA-125 / DSM 18197 / FERM 7344 / JCM 9153 / C-125) TaxID=272558 RepID=Q9KDU8_HALH5|nr:BH1113 [Halalkalibacterium halodurans C-125]